MKKYVVLAAVAVVALAAAAPPTKDVFAGIAAQIQGPLKELTATDADEQKLRTSEQAQIFASDAEKKQRARLKSDAVALQMEADQADRMRQSAIDSGCPAGGGSYPADLVARCNPLIESHATIVKNLKDRAASMERQAQTLNELRDGISATVLANVVKRKAIDANRERLMAQRNRLQALAVAAVISRNKLGAAQACKSACCHSVIYDGADPKLCGSGLVCQSFQSAGLFGSKNPICVATPRARI